MCVQVVGGGWIDGWLVGRVDAVRVFMYVCMCAHTAFSACLCGQEFAGERAYVRMYVWSLDCRKAIVAPKDLSVMNTAYIRMYLRGFAGLGLTEAVGGLALRRRRRQAHRDDEELPWPSSMCVMCLRTWVYACVKKKGRKE